jgi:hypothetical protein
MEGSCLAEFEEVGEWAYLRSEEEDGEVVI